LKISTVHVQSLRLLVNTCATSANMLANFASDVNKSIDLHVFDNVVPHAVHCVIVKDFYLCCTHGSRIFSVAGPTTWIFQLSSGIQADDTSRQSLKTSPFTQY